MVTSRPDEEKLVIWQRGVVLEDGTLTPPAEVRLQETHGKGTRVRAGCAQVINA